MLNNCANVLLHGKIDVYFEENIFTPLITEVPALSGRSEISKQVYKHHPEGTEHRHRAGGSEASAGAPASERPGLGDSYGRTF